jgi:hypothetical protein
MSLEANKFLGRLYGEAVANQQRQDREVREKVKQVSLNEIGEVMATKQLNQRDYQFFKRLLNSVAYEVFQVNNIMGKGGNKLNILSKISDIISDWNNVVAGLSRVKYNSLITSDKNKVDNDLKEIVPSLIQLQQRLTNASAIDAEFKSSLDVITKIINQIQSSEFKQTGTFETISYPLDDLTKDIEEDEEEDEGEDEEEDEEEED